MEGRTWGGCLEILSELLTADREVARDPAEYNGHVPFLETTEELPAATEVFRILRCLGERGLLTRFAALIMGRAKRWSFEHPTGPEERTRYAHEQREAVLRALSAYARRSTGPPGLAGPAVGGGPDPQELGEAGHLRESAGVIRPGDRRPPAWRLMNADVVGP